MRLAIILIIAAITIIKIRKMTEIESREANTVPNEASALVSAVKLVGETRPMTTAIGI